MKSLFYLFLVLGLLTSCIKVVDIDVDQIPTQLVVNCFFTENEPFNVNVSRLAAYPDLSDRNIENANVFIFENGKQLGKLNHTKNGIYTNPLLLPIPGNSYTIKVEVEGFPIATASDSLPSKVKIIECLYTIEASRDDEGDYIDEITVSFNDIKQASFYSVQLLSFEKYRLIWYPVDLFSRDPVLTAEGFTKSDYLSYFVFNDALFANGLYRLNINCNSYFGPGDKFRVLLETGTENYYRYKKRLLKHEKYGYQDPFKPYSPVPLFSNFENGLGVFAGYQRDIYSLTLQ